MTTEVNSTISRGEDHFKSLVWDSMVRSALISAGLNFWPVNIFLSMFTDLIFGKLRLGFDLGSIAFINAQHKSAYDKASVTLKVIAYDKGEDSDEYKKARAAALSALSGFVRFNT
jgi:hypothetical protein